jgi:small subunit ribosomal protein S4
MGRYIDNKCKLCRREGMKLFLKGQRCFTDKCAVSRRDYPPGVHAQKRAKVTDFGVRVREKQKLKRIYGVWERQFKRRLDNVVLAAGFALSRNHARQLCNHGHFAVNGRFVDVASFSVRPGDAVSVRDKEAIKKQVAEALEINKSQPVPAWLEVNRDNLSVRVVAAPRREDVPHPIQEQLIIELCSK